MKHTLSLDTEMMLKNWKKKFAWRWLMMESLDYNRWNHFAQGTINSCDKTVLLKQGDDIDKTRTMIQNDTKLLNNCKSNAQNGPCNKDNETRRRFDTALCEKKKIIIAGPSYLIIFQCNSSLLLRVLGLHTWL